MNFGPDYRSLVQAWRGTGTAAALLRERSARYGTHVYPADMDAALCTGALMSGSGSGDGSDDGATRLPFAVDEVRLQSVQGEMWAVRWRYLAYTPLDLIQI